MATKPPTHDPRHRTPEQRRLEKQSRAKADAEQPWRAWYKLARWKRLRRWVLDNRDTLCRRCAERGVRTLANVVDHVVAHRGEYDLFWDADNLQGLCTSCHSSAKQREERRAQ